MHHDPTPVQDNDLDTLDQRHLPWGIGREFRHAREDHARRRRPPARGYKWFDCHVPFPVHGLDWAMGVKYTILPIIVFFGGSPACAWRSSCRSSPTRSKSISGPSCRSSGTSSKCLGQAADQYAGIRAGGIRVDGAVLGAHHGVRHARTEQVAVPVPPGAQVAPRLKRITDDRFVLVIEAKDPNSRGRTPASSCSRSTLNRSSSWRPDPMGFLRPRQRGAVTGRSRRPWGVPTPLLGCRHADRVRSLLMPPAVIYLRPYGAEDRTSDPPDPEHGQPAAFQGAADQRMFRDNRAMRPPVPGTIARDAMIDDTHLWLGTVDGAFATTFPDAIVVIARCLNVAASDSTSTACPVTASPARATAPCTTRRHEPHGKRHQRHGLGAASQSAFDEVVTELSPGRIFHTISNGLNNMARLCVADSHAGSLGDRGLDRGAAGVPQCAARSSSWG